MVRVELDLGGFRRWALLVVPLHCRLHPPHCRLRPPSRPDRCPGCPRSRLRRFLTLRRQFLHPQTPHTARRRCHLAGLLVRLRHRTFMRAPDHPHPPPPFPCPCCQS